MNYNEILKKYSINLKKKKNKTERINRKQKANSRPKNNHINNYT